MRERWGRDGEIEGRRQGRDRCQSEEIIVPERVCAIRVTFSGSFCQTAKASHVDGGKHGGM